MIYLNVVLEFVTALLEYIDLFKLHGQMQASVSEGGLAPPQ